MKTMMNKALVMSVAGMLLAVAAQATPQLIVSQDGDPTPFTGWTEVQSVGGNGLDTGTSDAGTAVGGNANAIEIDVAIGTTSPDLWIAETSGANLIANGDMTAYVNAGQGVFTPTEIAGISFDFYAPPGNTLPSDFGVYFVSSGDGVWAYDLTTSLSSGWNTYYANFGTTGAGWFNFTDNTFSDPGSGTFSTALTDVTAIGVYALFSPNESGTYGIDNFGLTVPEPETYMILGMALLSVAVVFRKRITDSLAEARAMLQV